MTEVEKAEALMRNGDYSEAKDLLNDILVDEPDDLRAICDIGIAFTETGENEKAILTLNHYVERDESNPYAWEALGCARFRTGNYPEARRCLVRSLDLLPENPSSLRNLGVLFGLEGRPVEGLDLLERSRNGAPEDFRTLYALAYAYTDHGDTGKAAGTWKRLLELPIPEEVRRDAEVKSLMSQLGWS